METKKVTVDLKTEEKKLIKELEKVKSIQEPGKRLDQTV